MDQRPIGVFDSGSGGLTAVREIRSSLPSENIIYFGDTSRVPYGGRSAEILLRYARQDVHFLRSFDVKALLVACGTVSTTALPTLASENDLPILGVVTPTCAAAVKATRNKKVGLIATAASVRSGAYERTLGTMDRAIQVYAKACPLFVPLVGERFDGHAYIGKALESGAAGCLTAQTPEVLLPGKFYIQVENTRLALKALVAGGAWLLWRYMLTLRWEKLPARDLDEPQA